MALKGKFDAGIDVQLEGVGEHVVSSLMKLFLREMPHSLFTPELVGDFAEVIEGNSDSTGVSSSY